MSQASTCATCWSDSKKPKEHDENEMSNAKMDENRGRFLGVCFGTRHDDPTPVLCYSGQSLEGQSPARRGPWLIHIVELET